MRYLKSGLKIFISFGLLVYLVIDADPERILGTMTKIAEAQGLGFLSLALAFALLSILLMAIRWKILFAGYRVDIGINALFQFYLIGLFFNNFLPTSIGGDVVRVYKAIDATGERTYAFSSVIVERILGIAATLFLAILSLMLLSEQLTSTRILTVSLTLFLFISLFMLILIRRRPFKLLLKIFEKITIFHIGERINKLLEAVHHFRRRRRILLYVFLISLFSQMAIVFMNYYVVRAFGINVHLSYLFMVVPVTFMLTMLPSINGLGVREFGYIRLLSAVGVQKAAAISLSFMNFIIPMIISIWGAVLFIFQKRKDQKGGIDAIKASL